MSSNPTPPAPVTEAEVLEVQQKWASAIKGISKVHKDGGDFIGAAGEAAGELYAYPSIELPSTSFVNREGADQHELSLLDNVSADEMHDVCLGGDGAERNVPAGLLRGGDSRNERHPRRASGA